MKREFITWALFFRMFYTCFSRKELIAISIDMTLTELVENLNDLRKIHAKKVNAEQALVNKVRRLTQQSMDEKVRNVLLYAGQQTPEYQKYKKEFNERQEELKGKLMTAGMTKAQIGALVCNTIKEDP